MMKFNNNRELLADAILTAMRAARSAHVAVPVREVGKRIIADTHADPACLEDIVDALCTLSIRSGLAIEFSRSA